MRRGERRPVTLAPAHHHAERGHERQALVGSAPRPCASIPMTFLRALMVGASAHISEKYVVTIPNPARVPCSLPFIPVFVALPVLPRPRLAPPSMVARTPPLPWKA